MVQIFEIGKIGKLLTRGVKYALTILDSLTPEYNICVPMLDLVRVGCRYVLQIMRNVNS